MNIEKNLPAECFIIHDAPALDPLTVFLREIGPRGGQVTIVCYGRAWSAYFGAMHSPLKQFLASLNADYLAGKMENQRTKRDEAYLNRICQAVIDSLKNWDQQ